MSGSPAELLQILSRSAGRAIAFRLRHLHRVAVLLRVRHAVVIALKESGGLDPGLLAAPLPNEPFHAVAANREQLCRFHGFSGLSDCTGNGRSAGAKCN